MDCKRIRELLVAYLDGEATPEQHERVHDHLSKCPTCRRELETLTSTQQHLRQVLRMKAAETLPSAQVWTRIQERVTRVPQTSFWEKLGDWIRQPAWQAAVVVVLVLTWSVMAMLAIGVIPGLTGSQSPAPAPPTIVVHLPPSTTPPTAAPTVSPTTTTPPPPVIITGVPPPQITLEIPPAPLAVQQNHMPVILAGGIIVIGCGAILLIWLGRRRSRTR